MEGFVCEFCGSKYKNTSALNQHKKISKKCLLLRNEFTGHKCDICERIFATAKYLETHKSGGKCEKKIEIINVSMTREEYDWYIINKPSITVQIPFNLNDIKREVNETLQLAHLSSITTFGAFIKGILNKKIKITADKISVLMNDILTDFKYDEFISHLLSAIKDNVVLVCNQAQDLSDNILDVCGVISYIGLDYLSQSKKKRPLQWDKEQKLVEAEKFIIGILKVLKGC